MTEQQIQIAKIATAEALVFMANKAGCTAEEIAATLVKDVTGNTARYFADLVAAAIVKVPAMLS